MILNNKNSTKSDFEKVRSVIFNKYSNNLKKKILKQYF